MISVSSSIRFMKRGHCGMAEKGEQYANANDLTLQPNKLGADSPVSSIY